MLNTMSFLWHFSSDTQAASAACLKVQSMLSLVLNAQKFQKADFCISTLKINENCELSCYASGVRILVCFLCMQTVSISEDLSKLLNASRTGEFCFLCILIAGFQILKKKCSLLVRCSADKLKSKLHMWMFTFLSRNWLSFELRLLVFLWTVSYHRPRHSKWPSASWVDLRTLPWALLGGGDEPGGRVIHSAAKNFLQLKLWKGGACRGSYYGVLFT